MSPRSKREYVEHVFLRYKRASRKKKKAILDEFCATLGYHRKHAIRVLHTFKRFTQPKAKKRGRAPTYQKEEILKPLKQIWLAANLPCSKRLKVILPLWLPGYSEAVEPLSLDVVKALRAISASTIDRLMQPIRGQYKKHGRSTTKPGTRYPYRRISGTNRGPGSSKRIRLPIVANPSREYLPIPSISSISRPAGLNNGLSGGKRSKGCSSRSTTWKGHYRFPFLVSIATTAPSFSITISYVTSCIRRCSLRGAGPTTRMTTPISSRRIGAMYVSGSATND